MLRPLRAINAENPTSSFRGITQMGKCILITEARRSSARLDRGLPRNNRPTVFGRGPAHQKNPKAQAPKRWPSGWFWSWIWKRASIRGEAA